MDIPKELFEKDALNRSQYATRVASFIRSQEKAVIAIDGDWGAGKTWFGERLKGLLEADGKTKSVWINTFEADWDDDPALTLLASFASLLPPDRQKRFFELVTPILGKAVTSAARLGFKAAGAYLGLGTNTVQTAADLLKDAGDEYLARRLRDLTERKKSLEELRRILSEAVNEFDGKLVVFVDELDRCSPSYAIRFLERLKHLFEIQGVVYVLLWNREQIQGAVKAFYGPDTDGRMYLDKFVDYPLHLPPSHWPEQKFPMNRLIASYVEKLDGRKQHQFHENARLLSALAASLRMTARETLRVASWWALSPERHYVIAETWLLCLKVKKPDLYEGIRRNAPEAHQKAADLLDVPSDPNLGIDSILFGLKRLHARTATGDYHQVENQVFNILGSPHSGIPGFFEPLIERLESTFS